MARFDLFRLPGDQGYVVDVQSNHASEKVRTRVVVPLVPVAELGKPIADLNPVLHIDDRDYAFVAQSLATLTYPEMGERVGSLMADHANWVRFGLAGDGKLMDNLGTSTGSRYVQMCNGIAIIKIKTNGGNTLETKCIFLLHDLLF